MNYKSKWEYRRKMDNWLHGSVNVEGLPKRRSCIKCGEETLLLLMNNDTKRKSKIYEMWDYSQEKRGEEMKNCSVICEECLAKIKQNERKKA